MSLSSIHFTSALSPIDSPEINQSKVQFKPDELQSAINNILADGIKNHSSKDFMTDQILTLLNQNPDTAKELKIEPDFQRIKKDIVEPAVNSLDKTRVQDKPCAAKGYLNVNTSFPFATTGVMLNSCGDFFFYGGVALSTPSFAITASPGTISEGWNRTYQLGYVAMGGSVSYDSHSMPSVEGGMVTTGISASLYYVKKLN